MPKMNELEQLKKEIEELKVWKRSLEASHSIPLNVDQALRARLGTLSGSTITSSSKAASSENRLVEEAGTDTFNVLLPPDAFLQVTVGTTVYYIPVFT